MTRWAFILSFVLMSIPAGAQAPFDPNNIPICSGGEIGYWQFAGRPAPKEEGNLKVWLILTRIDVADPAFAICWVDGRHRIQALGLEKGT